MSDQTQQEAPRKLGRPPKPGRTQIHYLVPGPLADLLKRDAAANSVSASDRLAEILAAHYYRHGREAMQEAS